MNVLVKIPDKIADELLRQKAIHLSNTEHPDYGAAVLEILKLYFQGQKESL